ncbi:MAG: YggS family pyridoxal phosphate-dependent enzyme [Treponema sp.]|nr:YggS family pyridoxal phosphate-dependent enzyme [Treponema sp.]
MSLDIYEGIKNNLISLEEKIEDTLAKTGRKRDEVRLMGVSKFQSLEVVEHCYKAGLRLFGESRVQEGTEKFKDFRPDDLELHFVGPLQRNKAKKAVSFFDCIQSVDRDSLIEELGALTLERETPLIILLEYHTAEESKSGFKGLDSIFRAAERAIFFPGLKPAGLMTMAPFTENEAEVRTSFRALYEASLELAKRFPGEDWSCLSMGMTSDFKIAIEEGSTLIRIGSAIFGDLKT